MNFEEATHILNKKLNCTATILFGSYSRGDQREDSDVDIAIKSDKKISKQEIFDMTGELEQVLKKDVDLVNLDDISDSFRYEILMNGKVLYCKDNFKFDLYKLDMFREYLELSESRKIIANNIKKGGTTYENEAVILNKFESIERCIKRINEEYEENPENLNDYRRLDSIVLNLQRSCELVTDIAMYIVSCRKLGMPQEKREAFELLQKNGLITEKMADNMKKMIGFRNIAVHGYKKIDEKILKDVIENHLNDLLDFARTILNLKRI